MNVIHENAEGIIKTAKFLHLRVNDGCVRDYGIKLADYDYEFFNPIEEIDADFFDFNLVLFKTRANITNLDTNTILISSFYYPNYSVLTKIDDNTYAKAVSLALVRLCAMIYDAEGPFKGI